MKSIFGVEYGRGCTAQIVDGGPALAPARVHDMFPDAKYTSVAPDDMSVTEIMADRFGENYLIQKKIYAATPRAPHIMIGGDHSVNFGHFARLADDMNTDDLCLIYIDAHLDIHTPESSTAQASGAPHGANVRALLGDGDARWLKIAKHTPALKPENVFYIGTRSFEAAEIEFVRAKNIFMRGADTLKTMADIDATIADIKVRIGNRPFVVSFDFDAIDPEFFPDVLVPENGGLTVDMCKRLLGAFVPSATGVEYVEYAPSGDDNCAQIVRDLVSIALND